MTLNKRAKLGIALVIAVLAGLTSGLAGMLVLVIAWLLIVWGQAPERTETFYWRFARRQLPPQGIGVNRPDLLADVLKAPDGDRFIVIGEHAPENFIYDPHFLGMERSPDFILIQVTSTVGNSKKSKLAFFRYIADELKSKLSVRPDDVMVNLVFVDRADWSFGRGEEPW